MSQTNVSLPGTQGAAPPEERFPARRMLQLSIAGFLALQGSLFLSAYATSPSQGWYEHSLRLGGATFGILTALWLILGVRWPVYVASLALPVATLGFWGQRVAMSREPGSPLWYVGGAVVAVLVWNAVIAWRAAAARRS